MIGEAGISYVHTALRHGACGFQLKHSGAALLVSAVRAVVGDALIMRASSRGSG